MSSYTNSSGMRNPTYYYVGQKVSVMGADDLFDFEDVTVKSQGSDKSDFISVMDSQGVLYDVHPTKLFSAAYTTYYNQGKYQHQPAKPKVLATAYDKFSDADTKLIKLLKLTTHQDVVYETFKGIDVEAFDIFSGPMWHMVVPKNTTGLLPVLLAHTDTVHKNPTDDNLEYDEALDKLFCTSGLGADDRAGCFVISEVIRRHPTKFAYVLFDKEEVGCQGSKQFRESNEFQALDTLASCYISIDRKRDFDGGKTIATYGFNSADLNILVSKATGRKIVGGSVTDCKQLSEKSTNTLACFNFSCGYLHEHTFQEVLYVKEVKEVILDIDKLVKESPTLWTTRYKYPPAVPYVKPVYTQPAKSYKDWDDTGYMMDDCVIIDGEAFQESDVITLLWCYKQLTGFDYSLENAQSVFKEYNKNTCVRLDPAMVAGCSSAGLIIDFATYSKLKKTEWIVTSFNDEDMTLELKSVADKNVKANNIPYAWMQTVLNNEPYVG